MGTVIHGDDPTAGGISLLWKFTATNYADLLTKVGMVEGDLAIVYNAQGVWLVNRKLKGVYIFQSGVWEYANDELQNELEVSQYKVKIDSLDDTGGFLEDKFVPNADFFFLKSLNPNKTLALNTRDNIKPHLAILDPTISDDSSVVDTITPFQPIHRIGQTWVNVITLDVFIAQDLSVGAAVWLPLIPVAAPVTSVFGRVGVVVAAIGDYTAAQVTNAFDKLADTSDAITEGTINLFLTTIERAKLGFITVTQAVNLDTMESDIATNNSKVGITPTQAANIVTNNAKITNSTHTGEVTGSGVLTVHPTAISNKTLDVALLGTEEVLMNEAGTLKKTTTQAIADLGGGTSPTTTEASATGDDTTTSATPSAIVSMTITPASGDYLVSFTSTGNIDDNNEVGTYAIYVNGVIHSGSSRTIMGIQNADIGMATHGKVTVNGSQAIDIRFSITGGATFTVHDRILTVTKVG